MLYKTISYYVNLPNFYLLVLSPLGVPLISLWCNTVQWVCRRTIVVGYFATNVVVQDLKIVRLTEGKDLIMSYSNHRSTYISNIVIINDVFQVVIDNKLPDNLSHYAFPIVFHITTQGIKQWYNINYCILWMNKLKLLKLIIFGARNSNTNLKSNGFIKYAEIFWMTSV